jgi:hypothetical protein
MRVVVAMALGATLGSCASVTRGHTNQVHFASEPAGAELRTSMGHSCTTPCTLQFSRKDEFVASFSKPGYHPALLMVITRLAGEGAAGFAGNLLIGGGVGMVVDAASGATLEHCPNPVLVTLHPVGRGRAAAAPADPVEPAAGCRPVNQPTTTPPAQEG